MHERRMVATPPAEEAQVQPASDTPAPAEEKKIVRTRRKTLAEETGGAQERRKRKQRTKTTRRKKTQRERPSFTRRSATERSAAFSAPSHCTISLGKEGEYAPSGRTGTDALQPRLRADHRREHRSDREEAPLPFPPGVAVLFHRHRAGCNFKCMHCQNYDISQYPKEHDDIPGEGRDAGGRRR
ncbi:MAG: hypothetical protein MZV70_58805 [Desulfobacterales bacterium]|nr:hypothetical protein [Desulfobacterales bacterium]